MPNIQYGQTARWHPRWHPGQARASAAAGTCGVLSLECLLMMGTTPKACPAMLFSCVRVPLRAHGLAHGLHMHPNHRSYTKLSLRNSSTLAFFLTNCRNTVHPNQVQQHFKGSCPTLESYIECTLHCMKHNRPASITSTLAAGMHYDTSNGV